MLTSSKWPPADNSNLSARVKLITAEDLPPEHGGDEAMQRRNMEGWLAPTNKPKITNQSPFQPSPLSEPTSTVGDNLHESKDVERDHLQPPEREIDTLPASKKKRRRKRTTTSSSLGSKRIPKFFSEFDYYCATSNHYSPSSSGFCQACSEEEEIPNENNSKEIEGRGSRMKKKKYLILGEIMNHPALNREETSRMTVLDEKIEKAASKIINNYKNKDDNQKTEIVQKMDITEDDKCTDIQTDTDDTLEGKHEEVAIHCTVWQRRK